MNYSNTPLRPSRALAEPPPAGETVLSLETDRRGTHLRVRKVETILRRARRTLPIAAALLLGISAHAQFIIDQSTGLFSPSFRNTLTLDGGNTTWFGWTGAVAGGFDGATLDQKVDDPAVTNGVGGLDGHINQVGTAVTLATSKNIFLGDFANNSFEAHFTLQIPTNGTPGLTGFTTIILQGLGSVTGGGTQVAGLPGTINGVSPTYLFEMNVANPARQQWWAKYEIPGNASSYDVDLAFAGGAGINPGSLRELAVDTQYSTTGYASDTAAVPEPSVAALLGGVGVFMLARRRR
jgi:hypothetical protein